MRAIAALMLAISFTACYAAESLEGKYSGGIVVEQKPGPRQMPVELILATRDGMLMATWNQANVVCQRFQTFTSPAVLNGDVLELRLGPKAPQGQCAVPSRFVVQGSRLSADTEYGKIVLTK